MGCATVSPYQFDAMVRLMSPSLLSKKSRPYESSAVGRLSSTGNAPSPNRPPTCECCGRPTRIGERGPIRYCSSACKSTAQARRRHGYRPAISRTTGRLLVRDRRDATA